jgi:hypothetical protein
MLPAASMAPGSGSTSTKRDGRASVWKGVIGTGGGYRWRDPTQGAQCRIGGDALGGHAPKGFNRERSVGTRPYFPPQVLWNLLGKSRSPNHLTGTIAEAAGAFPTLSWLGWRLGFSLVAHLMRSNVQLALDYDPTLGMNLVFGFHPFPYQLSVIHGSGGCCVRLETVPGSPFIHVTLVLGILLECRARSLQFVGRRDGS